MILHPREKNTNRFHLFEQLFPDFKNKDKLLDFGGNRGNLLYFSNGVISEENYTSVDVSLPSIHAGSEEFPNATFVYYDRWNSMYNHVGRNELNFPDVDKKQDYIFSFSVFTHTDFKELVNTLKWFETFDYKMSAHSLLDIRCRKTVEWFYNKRCKDYGSCEDILSLVDDSDVKIVYLYDNHTVVINEETAPEINSDHFLTLYDIDWITKKLNVNVQRPTPDLHPFIIKEKQSG